MAARLGKSILGLIFASFVLVSVPLIAAVVVAFVDVSRLSEEANVGLARGVQIAQLSQNLAQEIDGLKRYARQYLVLGEEEQLALYEGPRQRLGTIIAALQALSAGDLEGLSQLAAIAAQNDAIQQVLIAQQALRRRDTTAADAPLAALDNAYNAWERRSSRLIAEGSTRVRESAVETRQLLTRLLITTVPAALAMMLVFTFLISRPLRAVSEAIRDLGAGGSDEPIRVRGPADLEALGRELDALRRRLQVSERQKQGFLRHMSHELKTPLASLLEGTELLVDGSLGELRDAQVEVAHILRSNAQELRHLIENLLDYSAWQANGSLLAASEFEFQILCQQVLDHYRLGLLAKNVSVDQRIIPMRVRADREKLRTVLSNLLSNAVKYSPSGGTVHLRALRLGEQLVLDVADAGPNIPREERENVFEPFFTGTPPAQSHLRGSGIGLSLVREYVLAHGGRVELVDGPYHGAHFRVTLPILAARDEAQSDARAVWGPQDREHEATNA